VALAIAPDTLRVLTGDRARPAKEDAREDDRRADDEAAHELRNRDIPKRLLVVPEEREVEPHHAVEQHVAGEHPARGLQPAPRNDLQDREDDEVADELVAARNRVYGIGIAGRQRAIREPLARELPVRGAVWVQVLHASREVRA